MGVGAGTRDLILNFGTPLFEFKISVDRWGIFMSCVHRVCVS